MAITFTNIYKDKILDVIKGFLDEEFSGVANVYVGDTYKNMGNTSIRIGFRNPSSELLDMMGNTSNRRYHTEVVLYNLFPDFKRVDLDHVTRLVARIERLLWNNRNQSSGYIDGSVLETSINAPTDEESAISGLIASRVNYSVTYHEVI